MSDAELVGRARAGDASAFGALVSRHQRLVVAVALAITGDRARAEDAAQEAFVTAWRTLGSLREEARVGSWIAGIARHRALDAVRAASRTAHPPSEGGSYHEAPTPSPGPLDHLLDAEEHVLLSGALAALPESQRETVVLHYFEGQSVRAVASALEVSEDTVKQRLHRARETLRDRVADRLAEALERARPTAAFTTAVLATIGALTAGTASATAASATAAKGATLMTTKQLVVGLGALALASGGAVLALRAPTQPPPPASPRALVAVSARAPEGEVAAPTSGRPPAPSAELTTPATHVRKIDPARRTRLAAAIQAARNQRELGRSLRASATHDQGSLDDADKDLIRDRVREILPLIEGCYEAGLGRDPELMGSIVVQFTIEGEPDVGGLVGTSAIDAEESTLRDAETHECIRETMYALELPPPSDGGVVNVTYPFTFLPAVDEVPTPPPAR